MNKRLCAVWGLAIFLFGWLTVSVPAETIETPKPAGTASKKTNVSKIYGKIKIVDHFPDYKVKIVDHFPDLKVKKVDHFPDGPGKWQIVEHFPDFTIQIVEHFPDFTIQWVEHFPGL